MSTSTALHPTQLSVSDLTHEQISSLSRKELLHIVRSFPEPADELVDIEHDHRQYLEREQLERLVRLVQQLCWRRGQRILISL